jgi:hypothetical protein
MIRPFRILRGRSITGASGWGSHIRFTGLTCRAVLLVGLFLAVLPDARAAESGLISKPSNHNHSVQETIEGFKRAVKAKEANGWMVL